MVQCGHIAPSPLSLKNFIGYKPVNIRMVMVMVSEKERERESVFDALYFIIGQYDLMNLPNLVCWSMFKCFPR